MVEWKKKRKILTNSLSFFINHHLLQTAACDCPQRPNYYLKRLGLLPLLSSLLRLALISFNFLSTLFDLVINRLPLPDHSQTSSTTSPILTDKDTLTRPPQKTHRERFRKGQLPNLPSEAFTPNPLVSYHSMGTPHSITLDPDHYSEEEEGEETSSDPCNCLTDPSTRSLSLALSQHSTRHFKLLLCRR